MYLRLNPGQTLDDVPTQLLEDCAQLVKANSIQGNKMNNVKVCCLGPRVLHALTIAADFSQVVYTMWDNLNKTGDMDVGQVGFKDHKQVRSITVEKRINDIVNRLNKTKVEKTLDMRKEREDRDRKEREHKKQQQREQKKREEEEALRREEEKRLRSYDTLMKEENMTSTNKDANDSDDFM